MRLPFPGETRPLFETLLQYVESFPHFVFFVFLILCGIGLPFPEEVILVAAGYTSYLGHATALELFLVCGSAILVGDSLPFLLGRIFGPKLLRLRIVRSWIHTERLARFDNWFERRGRLTIFVARFLTGIRVPTFFAAGSMRMRWWRFLLMDSLGVLLSAPPFIALGYYGGDQIDVVVRWVRTLERGFLVLMGVGLALAAGGYLGYRRRRRRRLLGKDVRETFVGPTLEPDREPPTADAHAAGAEGDAAASEASETSTTAGAGEPPGPRQKDEAAGPEPGHRPAPEDAPTSVEPPGGHL